MTYFLVADFLLSVTIALIGSFIFLFFVLQCDRVFVFLVRCMCRLQFFAGMAELADAQG